MITQPSRSGENMVKGKLAKETLEALSKTKFARGAGIVGGAKVAEESIDNPYAQAAIGAAEGAALGAALGPWGAAGGAVAGVCRWCGDARHVAMDENVHRFTTRDNSIHRVVNAALAVCGQL